jgi:ell wall binding domain 2 (CWB2)
MPSAEPPAIVRCAVSRALSAVVFCALCCAIAGCSLGNEPSRPPQLGARSNDDQAAVKLGFPTSATKNTIRVGGGDAATDAAGVASALYPATNDSTRPTAVVLVDKDDWQGAVSGAVLAGRPIGAPLLLSDGGDLPAVSKDTLDRLKPRGSDLSRDAQVIRIGQDAARPGGFKTAVIEGKDPYERAAAIDRFFSAARGKPSKNVVVVSGERAQWALPAAAWAARSGDAVLPVKRNAVPAPIAKALREHERPDIYVLGPESVVGKGAVATLKKLGRVHRIQGRTPVDNAIAFARFHDDRSNFGWGVEVPGYNFTLASLSRPLDAAAAAPLATRGVFAPLVLTDKPAQLPKTLEDYFLSVQPGYEDDPGQAVYNRVWLLGDDKTISLSQQSRLDQITELVPVQANSP